MNMVFSLFNISKVSHKNGFLLTEKKFFNFFFPICWDTEPSCSASSYVFEKNQI